MSGYGFRYVGAQGLIAILSEIILIIYLIVLTVLAIRSMIKTRGKFVHYNIALFVLHWLYLLQQRYLQFLKYSRLF